MDEYFADGIVQVAVTGTVVRIDFGTHAMPDEDAPPQPEQQNDAPPIMPRMRLVMPVEGFGQSVALLEQVLAKLISDGVLTRLPGNQGPVAAAPRPGPVASPAPPAGGRSPNFPS
ncbi:MAG: hypothetical protein BroJett030_26580 [Alphaproteobacteria bacterium]|nr:MAG: hypothetical protein BroJett030_26580 [Alphaproteobacteria bacterium]